MQPQQIQQLMILAQRHQQQGQLQQAESLYRQILTHQPNHADATHSLGLLARQAGRNDIAVNLLLRSIQLNPHRAIFYANLAEAFRSAGRLDDAIQSATQAVALQSTLPEAHCNLGIALCDRYRVQEAIECFRRAIALRPTYALAHACLGNALRLSDQLELALDACRKAVSLQPNFADAHNILAGILKDMGYLAESAEAFHRAASLGCVDAYNNLGIILQDLGRLDDGIECYRKTLSLDPNSNAAHGNLLLAMQYHPTVDASTIFSEHIAWAQRHADPLRTEIEPHLNNRDPDRPLRVGYVSPDFRQHSVAYFIENILAHHNHHEFQIHAYVDLYQSDNITSRLQQFVDYWQPITGLSDVQVAQIIRQDQIDILIDLSGHTNNNRMLLFARKPAPIQVAYLGYQATTGMSTIDYRLTDSLVDPPDQTDSYYVEKLIRLPKTFACYRPPDDAPAISPLPAMTTGQFTFISFARLAKTSTSMLDLWARILTQLPHSRLVLMATGLVNDARLRILNIFSRHDIPPSRIAFENACGLSDYLAFHSQVDLALDTFPFNGHTTTCHGLWMGVPIITLAGDSYRSRMGLSVLTNLNLPDLIATSPDAYIQKAVQLAQDLPRLSELRSSLRDRMQRSPITDGPTFTRHLESIYRQIWHTWCQSPSPAE